MKALPAPASFLAPYLVLITLRLWVATVPGSDREGSLCCYPYIYEPLNTIPISICVSSKEAYVFRHEDSRWYDWLIKDEFFGRLDIEYGLSLIKAGESKVA